MQTLKNLMEDTVLEKIDSLWPQTNYCMCRSVQIGYSLLFFEPSANAVCDNQCRSGVT